MLDTGYSMLDARYWMLDAGYSMLDAGSGRRRAQGARRTVIDTWIWLQEWNGIRFRVEGRRTTLYVIAESSKSEDRI
jgi:hypothetical protein